MVKAKRWQDAKEFYTKGLAMLSPKERVSLKASHRVEHPSSKADGEEDRRKERELEEACYVNRALCNLELSM